MAETYDSSDPIVNGAAALIALTCHHQRAMPEVVTAKHAADVLRSLVRFHMVVAWDASAATRLAEMLNSHPKTRKPSLVQAGYMVQMLRDEGRITVGDAHD